MYFLNIYNLLEFLLKIQFDFGKVILINFDTVIQKNARVQNVNNACILYNISKAL